MPTSPPDDSAIVTKVTLLQSLASSAAVLGDKTTALQMLNEAVLEAAEISDEKKRAAILQSVGMAVAGAGGQGNAAASSLLRSISELSESMTDQLAKARFLQSLVSPALAIGDQAMGLELIAASKSVVDSMVRR